MTSARVFTLHAEARMSEMRIARLAGGFTHGKPLDQSVHDEVEIPMEIAEDEEELYQVLRRIPKMGIRANDLLIVEPRPLHTATTAECVLVDEGGAAYVGRWWAKRGRRALLDERRDVIVEGEGIRVLGAVTVIVRLEGWR